MANPLHQTDEEMVKDLLSTLNLSGCSVLDAGSGSDKVWYRNLSGTKYECELDDGCDFFKYTTRVDWVVGNPPFDIGWKFTEQASKIAEKGIAFLLNINGLNSLTPKRLQLMKDKGFEITSIKVVQDKRWFGRYYFVVFEKKTGIISWEMKLYSNE